MRSTLVRIVLVVGAIAVVAVGLSIVAAWQWIESRPADPATAAGMFEEARAGFADREPVVSVRDGAFVRRPVPDGPVAEPSVLMVLVYHRPSERLVRAEVPFWFLRLKGPASRRALGSAGVDLDELGLTVPALERYGPALVLDAERGDDRVLLWTR